MILDVHVAFLVAALAVLFGLTYSIGQFFDYRIREMQKQKDLADSSDGTTSEALNA